MSRRRKIRAAVRMGIKYNNPWICIFLGKSFERRISDRMVSSDKKCRSRKRKTIFGCIVDTLVSLFNVVVIYIYFSNIKNRNFPIFSQIKILQIFNNLFRSLLAAKILAKTAARERNFDQFHFKQDRR